MILDLYVTNLYLMISDLFISEVLHGGLGAMDPDALHRKCTDDYEQLREEFERYKLRAQSVLKSKNTKVGYIRSHVM